MTYPHWWAPIVIEMDFATLQDARWITLGGVGELPTVTEGAAYTELTWDDNTETAAFVKKGGYLGITIEAIDKDDTRRLRMAPQALAQAAWLTLGKSISLHLYPELRYRPHTGRHASLFNSPPLRPLADTQPRHHRTLTRRLGHDCARPCATRPSSTAAKPLGALTAPKYLLVPNELEVTALQILATEHTPGIRQLRQQPLRRRQRPYGAPGSSARSGHRDRPLDRRQQLGSRRRSQYVPVTRHRLPLRPHTRDLLRSPAPPLA